MDRKLFVKTSSNIAETQIKKLWGHLTCIHRPTHWYIVVSLHLAPVGLYLYYCVFLHTNTAENWKEFTDHQLWSEVILWEELVVLNLCSST